MSVRSGEGSKTWFRCDRFFNEGDKWYFSTRENTVEGPFDSKKEAEAELNAYIRHQNELENYGIKKSGDADKS